MKTELNDTEICEKMKTEVAELILEKGRLASENVQLKAKLDHLYRTKAFEMMYHELM